VPMIPTWLRIDGAIPDGASAVVIDAGGTNFRCALARFLDGECRIERMIKKKMPGIESPATWEEFISFTADAVEPLGYKRTILIFQPHTYSRTHALFHDFVEQLKRPDLTYLAEIYAAREQNTIGISSEDLARQVPNALFFPSFRELETALRFSVSPGDLVLTVGAGDVYKLGEELVEAR